MKKRAKSVIFMVTAIMLIFTFSVTAFAAQGFHKVNGFGSEKGFSGTYESTTTKKCTRITAQGTSDNNMKIVTIMVRASKGTYKGKVVASANVVLNGKEQPLENFYNIVFSADTYQVTVSSDDTVGYEVSTFFYE